MKKPLKIKNNNMKKNVDNTSVNLNDSEHLKKMFKKLPKEVKSSGGVSGKIMAKIMENPKSIIPFVILFLYFALCGVGLNIKWIINFACFIINLF